MAHIFYDSEDSGSEDSDSFILFEYEQNSKGASDFLKNSGDEGGESVKNVTKKSNLEENFDGKNSKSASFVVSAKKVSFVT